MEKWFQELKSTIVNYRLDHCCWLLPVRIGCFVTAVFNIITDFICMVGAANEGFSPTITKVEEALIEDYVTKPPTLLAYTVELAMNVLLLCAVYRRDIVLMRIFMYYTIMALVMSFLLYSIIIAAVPMELEVIIVCSTLFQLYTIFLVRSYMVEIKLENRQYELPTLVTMSSLRKKELAKDTKIEQEDKTLNGNNVQEVKVTIDTTPEAKPKEEVKEAVKFEVVSKTPSVSVKPEVVKPKENVKEERKVEIKVTEQKKEEKKVIEDKKVDKKVIEDKKDSKKIAEDKKDSKKIDEKDDKKKELTKEKKPKEVKSVNSIFRRNKKETKNVTDAEKKATGSETVESDPKTDDKDIKLATVKEHPKE